MRILQLCILVWSGVLVSASLNTVVFSYDRPLQLYAFLESFEKYVSGCAHIAVVYRCSSSEFERAYAIVKERFPEVEYLEQNQPSDFKAVTLKALGYRQYDYIMFAVDDIMVTRPIDSNTCVAVLESTKAYACYLRLGKNISECYMENKVTGVPPLTLVYPGFYAWEFKKSSGDWAYPHTLDMAIYRMSDVAAMLFSLPYHAPNILEGNWVSLAHDVRQHRYGICPEYSCIVNCPLNVVQTFWPNRASNTASVKDLLLAFNAGLKMDIKPLADIRNISPHMDYVPTFVARE